jgi:hemerythrin-like domain-containing protein
LAKGARNRQEVIERGRQFIQWLRGHLLDENGRLFPMVERGLDAATQQEICQALEELGHETPVRLAEGSDKLAQA